MGECAMKYQKHISIAYEYAKSEEGQKALEEVYDIIFNKLLDQKMKGEQSKKLFIDNE